MTTPNILPHCPECHRPAAPDQELCACGTDLAWVRADLERTPWLAAYWRGESDVIPLEPFRHVDEKMRRELIDVVKRGRMIERKPTPKGDK